MYKLTIKDTAYTCPEESLPYLAIVKALDLNRIPKYDLLDISNAVRYLEELGIEVEHDVEVDSKSNV